MSVRPKVVKQGGATPDDFELSVGAALAELEATSAPELKTGLRDVHISAAKEVEVGEGRKAVVVFVPMPQLQTVHKIQSRLVRELEKKFSGKQVLIIGQRRILRKAGRNEQSRQKQPRPRSRTLTAVHESILEDIVFPSEITGKRLRVKHDGSKVIKVHLDQKDRNNLEYKLDAFTAVYKSLTGKDVTFEFPITE